MTRNHDTLAVPDFTLWDELNRRPDALAGTWTPAIGGVVRFTSATAARAAGMETGL